MAITPLQAYVPAPVFPESGVANKNRGTSSFETLLSSRRSADGSSPVRGEHAAAELLRLQMMHNSLSLSGDGETCRSSGSQALESLLAVLSGTSRALPDGKGPPARTTDAESALVGVAADGAPMENSAEIDEIGEIGETAAQFIGTPYRFGGEGPAGIDCSSFVQQVFQEHEIELPRTAREQIKMGSEVAQGELRKGDLVFFQTYASYPSHVGIYLGEGKMIHASSGKGEVTISDINSDYYRSRYLGAKRVA
ncbi:MAG: glycoside hydrolase [Geobacteraceae bacterium GWC2_58_44]|nr:MAG: glycoside hydrolase [Geobacteraceae bacterium GWC2_58_44]HBG04297.1 NlpC/P60 family protein [Geobacter sp.]